MASKRIAFVVCDYPLGVSLMVVNSIKMFAAKGYEVDIFVNKSNLSACPLELGKENVRLIVYDDTKAFFFNKVYRFILAKIAKAFFNLTGGAKFLPMGLCLYLLYRRLSGFSSWLKQELRRHDYDYVMPVECQSLLSLAFFKERTKIIYFNMELLDWSKKNPLYANKRILKHLEFRMIRRLSHVVIQSRYRAQLFSDINAFDLDKIHILPVASMGQPVVNKSTFFRTLFRIPDDHKIVIYAGNFAPWAQCLEIIRTVRDWPKGYSLVMHTWNKVALASDYFQEMEAAAKGLPVYFSSEYIDGNEMTEVLSSGDIGLMFYESIDGNFSEILFSSNKLGEYFKAGLPVICSDFPSLRQFVQENRVGQAIGSFDEFPAAVEAVGNNIEQLRNDVFTCYEQKYRFERYFDDFWSRLTEEGAAEHVSAADGRFR